LRRREKLEEEGIRAEESKTRREWEPLELKETQRVDGTSELEETKERWEMKEEKELWEMKKG
jgi:hypothetical protein